MTLLLTPVTVASADWGANAHQAVVIGAFEDARDEATLKRVARVAGLHYQR